ncbi:endonuclease IV, apurinic endonuclease [Candidatus Mycoplasma haematolamae str. Purdue]|uniref:Endonuclease IV, apurinic endonuclease n=1 Tax=Mycoplasma haematolamae (strain Purdue) TaxID=1212765 RepID=I7BKN8_MYCHA|nr:endonuclease IV, apurinic endonuclease [Candidatus Mycoplasma haematolamae str. Purdue]
MIFTGPPQNIKRAPIEELFLEEARELGSKNGLDFSNCVVHAPYIFNLAASDSEDRFIHRLLVSEITRMVEMGIPYFIVHPGYHNGFSYEQGIDNIVTNIKSVLEATKHLNYFFCLETMAGKSNQLGSKLEQLQEILERCSWDPKLAICLDTCHLHDAGYDLSKKEEFKELVDRTVGLNRVKVLHLGDSMNPRGSAKDRHANYGYGYIGWDTVLDWAYDPYFSTIPIIVETPYWRRKYLSKTGTEKVELISPYKHEIGLLRSKKWEIISRKDCDPVFNIKINLAKVS